MTTPSQYLLPDRACVPDRIAIVGAARMGAALAASPRQAGIAVERPLRRAEAPPSEARAVLLCVPDGESVANWAALGAERALTGPIARGDEGTVGRQRDALAERLPDELDLFDALVDATRRLADARRAAA